MEKFLTNNHHNLFQGKDLVIKYFYVKTALKRKKNIFNKIQDHKPCEILNLEDI